MLRYLVFLESDVKKKTIQGFLGGEYLVVATKGHLCELKKSGEYNLGVNLKTFEVEYDLLSEKKKRISLWKKIIRENNFECIFLATDPDREGEGIANEIIKELKLKENTYKRLVFQEITLKAIKESINNPKEINFFLVESQISRQVLDKMIGFCISPILFKKVYGAKSAGRVQSVVLKLIIEKEKEIALFEQKKKEFILQVKIKNKKKMLDFVNSQKKKIIFFSEEEAKKKIDSFSFKTIEIIEKETTKQQIFPKPPFITSSLLIEAKKIFNFSIEQTTKNAQKLYEGIQIGNERLGLITYPRTDSLRVNENFTRDIYLYISKKWKKENFNFFPVWKKQKSKYSQDAHESIHPTRIDLTPEKVKPFLTSTEFSLYKLIFENTLASFFRPAEVENTEFFFSNTVVETNEKNYFLTKERKLIKPGFFLIDMDFFSSEHNVVIESELEKDVFFEIDSWICKKYEPNKPFRYNEGSLVKELEKKGIGRPSTYNSFGRIILERKYAVLNNNRQFFPLSLGYRTNEWLQKYFSEIINENYTAFLEEKLDEISKGENSYINFIKSFWEEFSKQIKKLES